MRNSLGAVGERQGNAVGGGSFPLAVALVHCVNEYMDIKRCASSVNERLCYDICS